MCMLSLSVPTSRCAAGLDQPVADQYLNFVNIPCPQPPFEIANKAKQFVRAATTEEGLKLIPPPLVETLGAWYTLQETSNSSHRLFGICKWKHIALQLAP